MNQRLYTVRDPNGTLKAQLPELAAREIFQKYNGMWQNFEGGIRGFVLHEDTRITKFPLVPELIIFLWAGDVLIYPKD